jgi:hypothetical protein
MQKIANTPQEFYPMAVFETHVFQDHVIFTLPLHATLDTLVPLALELLHMPDTCRLEARLQVEDGQLVITLGRG